MRRGLGLAVLVLGCSSERDDTAVVRAASDPPDTVLLNEIEADPPGSDGNDEYVELIGPAGADLRGLRLVALEADRGKSRLGTVDWTADLQTICGGDVCNLGENGLFMLSAPGSQEAMDQRTAVAQDPALQGGGLENGSLVLMLVRSSAPPRTGDDWDTDDDCALDLPSDVSVLDAVGWVDGDPGDCPYVATLLTSCRPSAVTRFDGETCASCTSAWTYGTLDGTDSGLTYSTGVELTPGSCNPSRAAAGVSAASDAGGASSESHSTDDSAGHGTTTGGDASAQETDRAGSGGEFGLWRSPSVVVALRSEAAGQAGAPSPPEPMSDISTVSGYCACRLHRPNSRPPWHRQAAWVASFASLAVRRRRPRHGAVARRPIIR